MAWWLGVITQHTPSAAQKQRSEFNFLSLLSLNDGGGDSVHIGCSLLCQGLTSWLLCTIFGLVLDLTDETWLFELLEAVSDDLTGSLVLMGRSDTVSSLSTVVGLEGWDSNLSSHVELVCNWGSSNVHPVNVVRSEVLEASSLNVLTPLINIIILLNIIEEERSWLTSGILILLPFLRCLENASMNSLAATSFTVTAPLALITDNWIYNGVIKKQEESRTSILAFCLYWLILNNKSLSSFSIIHSDSSLSNSTI